MSILSPGNFYAELHLRSLNECPVPGSSNAFRRLIGIFANNTNWVPQDYHKLTFFKSHEGTGRFTFLSGATNFEEAIGIWDAQFKKPARNK